MQLTCCQADPHIDPPSGGAAGKGVAMRDLHRAQAKRSDLSIGLSFASKNAELFNQSAGASWRIAPRREVRTFLVGARLGPGICCSQLGKPRLICLLPWIKFARLHHGKNFLGARDCFVGLALLFEYLGKTPEQ